MYQDNPTEFLKKMSIQSDCIVINQCNVDSESEFKYNGYKILWINSTKRGLSCSRNMAIKRATADICVLSDDDLVYCDNYKDKIIHAFEGISDASVIRFEIEGIEQVFKSYPSERIRCGYVKSMKASSVEIAFKRCDIVDNDISFDECIGAGTEFLMGEENAFLFSCLRKKLKMYFEPQLIAKLHIGDSSWFKGYNDDYFIGRGAAFAAMSERFSWFLVSQFALRKYHIYKKENSFFNSIKLMFKGVKQYKKKSKY